MNMRKNSVLLGSTLLLLACGGGGGGENAGDGGFQQAQEPEVVININPESIIPNPSSSAYESLSSEAIAFVNVYAHQGNIPIENGTDELQVSLLDASKGRIYCFESSDCTQSSTDTNGNTVTTRLPYGKVQLDLASGRGMFAVTARDGSVEDIGVNVTVVGASTRRSVDVTIPVKYTSSGVPHQINVFANDTIAPNSASSIAITITDEAGNPVANSEANNLIVTASSLAGTTLGFNGTTGSSVYAKTNSGVANLSVLPTTTGFLTLTAQTDTSDYNVDNGIQTQGMLSATKTIQVANTQTTTTGDISILGTSLPNAVVGIAYSNFSIATNGSSLVSFAVTSGSLPAGMTFSNTGVLSGTPQVSGTYTFTVTATGANNSTATQQLTLTVVDGGFTFSRTSFDTITAIRNEATNVADVCSAQGQILTLVPSTGYTLAPPFTWAMDSQNPNVTTAIDSNTATVVKTANGVELPGLTFTVTDNTTQVVLNGQVCPSNGVFGGHAIILKATDNNGFSFESVLPLAIVLTVNPAE